jgi:sensor histidine kinase regulating citrate/malate metabolism
VRAMEQKKAQVNTLDFNNQWGWFVSAFAPILNSSGEAVGIIGCDFRAALIYERLWSQILRQLIISGILVIAGFAGYLYMVNGVNKQNRELVELTKAAEAARKEAETASLALKDERDTITAMKDALRVGLFFMDKNFVIQDQYSKYLETLLGVKDLTGKKFTQLLSASISEKDIQSLVEYFVLLFNRSVIHKMSEKMLEDLNPIQELRYTSIESKEEKILRWTFVPVDRGGGRLFVLGNIQDITNEKKMQEQLAGLDKHS